jgi:glycosyltransferase involved in cell wall biosynthesis
LSARRRRICIVYDRLYPASIGGAERWYRLLAERLAAEGHQVTYFTTRHWNFGEAPTIPGVRVVSCAAVLDIYQENRRRIVPVLKFGLAAAAHLLCHGRDYDVVHTSAMLSWTALVCVALTRVRGYRLILDWWEVWTLHYWSSYLGAFAGAIGWAVQRVVALSPHQPISYSALHARRLRQLRVGKPVPIVRGLLPLDEITANPAPADPFVVYFGRLMPEKQVPAVVSAIGHARRTLPSLRGVIFGEGPDTPNVERAIRDAELQSVIELPGFVAEDALRATVRRALCLILLSRREGYGLVVAEAAALGVPSIVLRHDDSAATELVVDGVNGIVCMSADPAAVASAILRIHDVGYELRLSTLAWSQRHTCELSISGSLPRLLALYHGEAFGGRQAR